MQDAKEFGRIRALIWPIHRFELKKILPMMAMLFLICFNYSVLRNVKEVVVITAQSSGAEVLPFIKVWAMLPMAILTTILLTKLSNHFSQEHLFYMMVGAFLLFYGLFVFVLYPLQDYVHPHHLADQLQVLLPKGFKGFIAVWRNWSFTLFYTMCELWSTIVMTVLFWGFANEITRVHEARRFYGVLAVISSSASILAGVAANWLSNPESWDGTLQRLMLVIIAFGGLTMAIFRWMNVRVLSDPRFHELHEPTTHGQVEVAPKKSKKRLSMKESVAVLSKSKYLLCIATIVVAYNLVINLVEVVWKDQLQQLYPSPLDYSYYMNTMTSAVGVIATLVAFCLSSLMGKIGWTWTALITPLTMLLTSVGFFGFMLFPEQLQGPVLWMGGMTPLAISVFFGAAQVCLSKAAKYSVFDATKEMSFIPLDHELKLKGKAAIDGVGSRLGKSGGSIIHTTLLPFLATVSASAPYVAGILLFVIVGWVIAVRSLGRQFADLVQRKAAEDPDGKLTQEALPS